MYGPSLPDQGEVGMKLDKSTCKATPSNPCLHLEWKALSSNLRAGASDLYFNNCTGSILARLYGDIQEVLLLS